MNTLSRLDTFLAALLVPAIPPPSPLSTPSSHLHPNLLRPDAKFENQTSFGSPHERGRSTRRRRKPTSSSIKLPPPSTPFFLRIALALWSILLSFWTSLVVETRAERVKRRTRRRVKQKISVKEKDAAVGTSTDDEASGSDGERGDAEACDPRKGEQREDTQPWVDPVTRAPEGAEGVDEPSDSEFLPRQAPDPISFRLPSARHDDHSTTPSAENASGIGVTVNPPTPERAYNLRSSSTNLPSILANPLPSSSGSSRLRNPTPPRIGPRLLPNPLLTSLLDPSVPLPPSPSGIVPHSLPAPLIRPHQTPFHLQKTLILDLDETLIHSTSRPLGYSASAGGGLLGVSFGGLLGGRKSRREGHTVEVVLGGRSTTYHVYKRPYVDHFLKKVASWYTLVIYTASMPEYADPVIDWLDAGRGLFAKRLYRESCFLQNNGSYIKDLALVEKDLSRVCFMDNSPISYSWNKANALPIEGWTSDPNDEGLLQSLPVLDCLRFVNDVRRILGIRGFS